MAATMAPHSANAAETYTPEQLRSMVDRGAYPEQGPVAETIVNEMDYGACFIATDEIMAALQPHYPVETIARTTVLQTMKAWANDGAVTVTCSALDGKQIITRAAYR